MSPADLIDDLRSRINPVYSAQIGTESYERRVCAETIETLLNQVDCVIDINENLEGRLNSMVVKLAAMKEQRDELLADRDTWKARAEFSYQERDKLEGKINSLLEVAQLANDNTAAAIRQRDELLAPLEIMTKLAEKLRKGDCSELVTFINANKAIASVKGSAS